ncbi:MAG: GNAT family N-acetyltransferase, partial [Anaerolineales bacterium]|nr:GNAT family N-acetyltransferase [Anaerolineales bacterium]
MLANQAFQTFPKLETRDLLLRRIHPSDASALFKILADDEATRFYDDDAFTDISQPGDQIGAWENGFKNKGCIRWGITRKEEGTLINANNGGVVVSPDGLLTLSIPPNALDDDTIIDISVLI